MFMARLLTRIPYWAQPGLVRRVAGRAAGQVVQRVAGKVAGRLSRHNLVCTRP